MSFTLTVRDIAADVEKEVLGHLNREGLIYVGGRLAAVLVLGLIVGSLALAFALVCGVLAVAYGALSVRWVLDHPEGNERMQEIAAAIREGASAYLNRQYTTIAKVGGALF
ncbi:MAG: sodium/proton-translocating pyrophosphatase, partial [Beggiatoa sp.]|nr:sodium/proton-translocating pyrophosphatase [Beggiatoa sp.]